MKIKIILTFLFCCAMATVHAQNTKPKINTDSLKKAKVMAAALKKAKADSVQRAKAATPQVLTVSAKKAKADSIKRNKLVNKPIHREVAVTTPQIFHGIHQFRSWSVGVNAGILSTSVVSGGENDFRKVAPRLGYGLQVRKQLGHIFGLQFDAMQGHMAGSVPRDYDEAITSFDTEMGYDFTTSVVANLGTISYLHRKHTMSFFILGGEGFMGFAPKVYYFDGTSTDTKYHEGFTKDKVYIHEFDTFGGIGVKFKINERVAFNIGYTEHFIDNDFLDGIHNMMPNGRDYQKDKFSYGYGSLEFSIGKRNKPNIDWINPVSLLYNEVEDHTVRDEFELLRLRLISVESTIVMLKSDSDQDGVPDYFDKCPNTPKGVVVDGAGCPVKTIKGTDSTIIKEINTIKEIATERSANELACNKTVLFNYNSSEVLPPYFNMLNAIAADLKANPTKFVNISGYSSSEGTSNHNMDLSGARAKAVKAYLIKHGADEKQLKIKSYGETKPVANNANEEGRLLNRRAQIY